MQYVFENNDCTIMVQKEQFDIEQTLFCGQCFRYKKTDDGYIQGVIGDRVIKIVQYDDRIIFKECSEEYFKEVLVDYFDLDTDYEKIKSMLCSDETLKKAIDYAGGIRILKQPKFEILCSFIVSQNNNIKRIERTIEMMCERFGEHISDGFYTFPTPEKLSQVTIEQLQGLSLGYRDRYIVDCASKVASGEIDLSILDSCEIKQARETLLSICGVGKKVAECVLLFGFYRVECFPVDTWIKKVMDKYYPKGLPTSTKGIEGIAQQYLFHYMRTFESK